MSDVHLSTIEQRLPWLSQGMIQNANHIRPKQDGIKIGGHPATLSRRGSVAGHRVLPSGGEHFGQTGTFGDLYHHFGLDAAAIANRVAAPTPDGELCA